MRIAYIGVCLSMVSAVAGPAFAQVRINPCEGYTLADLKSSLPFLRLEKCRAKCIPSGRPTPSDAELKACIDEGSSVPEPTGNTAPSSTFDRDAEGWTFGSFPDNGPYDRVDGGGTPGWGASDGRHGGGISQSDPGGGNFFFGAPTAFLGSKQQYYGGQLRYDLRTEGGTYFDEVDVILVSPGAVLVYSTHMKPSAQWTTLTIPLSEGGWKIGTTAGRQPTISEFQRVLGQITALRIRGEFGNGPDKAWLDNVSLSPGPGR